MTGMGLRGRLALFFVAITVLPLAVAAVALQLQNASQQTVLVQREVAAARDAAALTIRSLRSRAGDAATDLGLAGARALADRSSAVAQRLVDRSLQPPRSDRADFLVLVAGDGTPVAAGAVEGGPPAPAAEAAAAVAAGTTLPQALLEVREVRGGTPETLGWAVAGLWLDADLLARLPASGGAAILSDGQVMAANGAEPDAIPVGSLPPPGQLQSLTLAGEPVIATALELQRPGDGTLLLLWQPMVGGSPRALFLLAVLLPAVLVAAALGWVLASTIVAPVRRAADTARAVAAGDLDQTLEPAGGRELADLAVALNTMSAQLRSRLRELRTSRDELRKSLSRLGRTLSSSLDLDRTLSLVVETAMDTLGVDRAMLRLFTPERDALYVKVGRGVGRSVPRLALGEGVAGYVARTGVALRLPADQEESPQPSLNEPEAVSQLVVPMVGRGRIIGVLSLLRDHPNRMFSADDLDTVRTFAAQASVAVENVMLHQEAQRLSVTDVLTGLWNFRYFQLQAERELESAGRFERPLSLLIIDLDHFKSVNDVQGHQIGDEVLTEVARRIQAATRVPDIVARYGGEEFVVLLPGTGTDGAHATAERIRAAVGGDPVVGQSGAVPVSLSVTCSIGVATFPQHGPSVSSLLRSADAAMYTAKAQGRDRVVDASTATSGRLRGGRPIAGSGPSDTS